MESINSNDNVILKKFEFKNVHVNFENKNFKKMYYIVEEDIIIDADAAVIDNEMTKILINNSICPICIGVARINST